MKGLILGLFISLSATAQSKDTTIQITMSIQDYRAVLSTIDNNIDSKKVTKDLILFLQRSTKIVADKPKEIKPKQ
jgi:hypothetical protein